MNTNKRKLMLICAVHYVKLCYRSLLFLITIVMYVIGRIRQSEELFGGYEDNQWVLGTIWLVFAVEMACRFFTSRLESTGCGKQFKRNYCPTGQTEPKQQSWKRTLAVIAAWVLLNVVCRLPKMLRNMSAEILRKWWHGFWNNNIQCKGKDDIRAVQDRCHLFYAFEFVLVK